MLGRRGVVGRSAGAHLIAPVPYGRWRIRAGASKVVTREVHVWLTDFAIPAQVLVKWSPAGGVDLTAKAARLD